MAESLASLYREIVIERMGCDAEIDEHGNVIVHHDTGTFVIFHYPRDPEYLRVLYPNFFSAAGNGWDVATVERLCNRITRETRTAKVTSDPDGCVSASAEMYVAPLDCRPTRAHVEAVLPIAFAVIVGAVGKFARDAELVGIEKASQ